MLICFVLLFTNSCKKEESPSKKIPVITWVDPVDIYDGTLLSATELNATADVAGTFVYTPAIGTMLNIGANQVLKVIFTPTDAAAIDTVSKKVKINVFPKKLPIITWANPADITFGTLLSAIQLNATADVAGTFVYTPAIGTELSVGANQNLKVDFTPTDVIKYNTSTKTVTINVTFTDPRDGNVYHTVKIGNKVWMVENLRYLPSVVGSSNAGSLTIPCYYVYGYDGTNVTDAKATSNYNTYGVLYNWSAAMAGSASSKANPSGVQGVCPTGWHLPSDAEWTQLTGYFGSTSILGGKLKEIGTTHWLSPNFEATNETGFTALPGGYRLGDGTFHDVGYRGYWWSATEYDYSSIPVLWSMNYNNRNVYRNPGGKEVGFSIRCVRN